MAVRFQQDVNSFAVFNTTNSSKPPGYCRPTRAHHSATSPSSWIRPRTSETPSMKRLLLLVLLLFAAPVVGWSHFLRTPIPNDGVAYTSRGALIIKDATSKTVRVIRTTIPIGSFSISPDKRSVVFAPPGRKCGAPGLGRQGGPLYLLTLATGQTRRLIPEQTHIYGKREVYADPDFSPNGSQVVFAIHRDSCGDAVMTAGPYAVFNIRTARVRILASTVDPSGSGYGPAYGFKPRWSPNGQWILANFEDTFDLIIPSSTHLLGVSTSKNWIKASLANIGTEGIGWLGSRCVVFVAGETSPKSAYVLNLSTHRVEPLDKLLGVSLATTTNLIDFTPTIWVRQSDSKLVAETRNGHWDISNVDHGVYVRAIASQSAEQVPLTCR